MTKIIIQILVVSLSMFAVAIGNYPDQTYECTEANLLQACNVEVDGEMKVGVCDCVISPSDCSVVECKPETEFCSLHSLYFYEDGFVNVTLYMQNNIIQRCSTDGDCNNAQTYCVKAFHHVQNVQGFCCHYDSETS